MTHEQECIEVTARMLLQYPEIQAVIGPGTDGKSLRCNLSIQNSTLPGIVVHFTEMVNFLPTLRLAVSNCAQKIQGSRGLIVDIK